VEDTGMNSVSPSTTPSTNADRAETDCMAAGDMPNGVGNQTDAPGNLSKIRKSVQDRVIP